MREIKFRGKRVDNGKWAYGNLIYSEYGNGYEILPFKCRWERHNVDPKTVGQYTGLKDKNDKEIYDGDIAKNRHGDICIIKHVNTGFYPMRNKDGSYSKVTNWNGIKQGEVIGNIYENPELLN